MTSMMMQLSMVIAAYISVSLSQRTVETETLSARQVNQDGFGDVNNNYAWSMEVFDDALYVGTLNAPNFPGMAAFFLGLPFDSDGAQIWKGTKRQNTGRWQWEEVLSEGNGNIDNYGVRRMHAIGDYLYGVSANHISGFEVWRTSDGSDWEIVQAEGFGDKNNTSGRGLLSFGGYLYVGGENRRSGAKMWRRAIKDDGDFTDDSEWEEVVSDGGGDPANWWFSAFVEYKGYMYAGTLNINGMQLYRTSDGKDWQKVFDQGNGNPMDTAVMTLQVYNDKLYVGTMNFFSGSSLYVNTDDDGMVFDIVFIEGNGNRMNHYVWDMQEFNDRLYVGTFKSFGEFDLFSAEEPGVDDWVTETDDGFGNEFHYGVRAMTIYDDKLMIGTATARASEACKIYEADSIEGGETVEDILSAYAR